MKLPALLTRVLPTLNRAQECPACGEPFACEINLNGCWCSEVKLSSETLQVLRSKYNRCLCRSCLESAQAVSERAKGAEYDSQGQAQSASPLNRVPTKNIEP